MSNKVKKLMEKIANAPRMVFGKMCRGDNSPEAIAERVAAYEEWQSRRELIAMGIDPDGVDSVSIF